VGADRLNWDRGPRGKPTLRQKQIVTQRHGRFAIPGGHAEASLDSDFPSRYQIRGLIKDPLKGSSGAKSKKREE